MNEFSNQLGGIAQNVSKDFALTASDDSAALIRRAKRGRVVWTGTVGTATLASAAVIAIGGSSAASSLFGESLVPATHTPSSTPTESATDDASATPSPTATETEDATPTPAPSATDDHGDDDPATHDKDDDKADGHKSGSSHSGKQVKDCDGAKGDDDDHSGKDDSSERSGSHHRGGDDRDTADDDHPSGDDASEGGDSGNDGSGGGSDDAAGSESEG